MNYLNKLIQKWMPSGQRVAVDSVPSLHGIFDTINSTLATNRPQTRLPAEFYDARGREIIDRITVEEEYSGYKENLEYRTLGIGAFLGDVVQRMVHQARRNQVNNQLEPENRNTNEVASTTQTEEKMVLAGCHDSTIAATLASLGAMEGENNKWPSYTSSLAIELFREATASATAGNLQHRHPNAAFREPDSTEAPEKSNAILPTTSKSRNSERERVPESLTGFYVRLRYNDRPVSLPGCKSAAHHLPGDQTFCTLVSCRIFILASVIL